MKIRRPTVVVGGELTMDNLEIRHDPATNVSEASIQLKSNCGCLLIDDFGRQRIDPAELLNRWIVPLENRHDYLTLATGKKIQVPFEQLIIFSTNLEPQDLVDEAFLRRIPYKIEVKNPSVTEFSEAVRGGLHARFAAASIPKRSTTCCRRTSRLTSDRCAAATPATCSHRSATTAITTAARSNCGPITSTASSTATSPRAGRRSRSRSLNDYRPSAHGRIHLPCNPIFTSTTSRCPATA